MKTIFDIAYAEEGKDKHKYIKVVATSLYEAVLELQDNGIELKNVSSITNTKVVVDYVGE